jgi:hypothetical protein
MQPFDPTEISRGARVAWVTQGIVLYIEGDLRSHWPSFLIALRYLFNQRWTSSFVALRRSNEPTWQAWDPRQVPTMLGELAQRGTSAPFIKYEFADHAEFSTSSLDWQDLPPAQGKYPRASYLRLRFPLTMPSNDLLEVTRELATTLPVQQGRAGYFCHVQESNRKVGFDQAWAWCRRYYGLDIIDSPHDTWDAVKGILGVNWLTIIGERWLKGPLRKVNLDKVDPTIVVHRGGTSVILQAGAHSSVGDQNIFEDVSAYSRASALVEPAFIPTPTELPGMFDDHESTKAWIRRFLDPSAWRDA